MKTNLSKMACLGLAVCFAVVAAGSLGGCAGTRHEQSTGEYIDDTGTTSRVKRALGDDTKFKYDNVEVNTFKGTVQLSGFVSSSDQKRRAAELIQNVEGVKEVVNNITVKE